MKSSRSHRARKALFQRGIQRGTLTVAEIDRALPPGSLSDAERWLLFYSLRASGVEIVDEGGRAVGEPDLPAAPPE
ncbi:MAG TPA: RNA polymerase sigma factor region1.1 domain-containing protein [Anaeromyxobacteraceae bacterium]|nr:RNA polymerase sigma factor region1.1 domain-containing protein [Anaeromyxobacteraceae bacterium]